MLTSVQENVILYSMTNTTNTKYSEFVNLTEMWQDGYYLKVGELIANEKWGHCRLAEFCSYVAKHLGVNQLNLLYKFL
jgi:hypothetical protein